MREFLYYIGWIIFIGSIVVAIMIFSSLDSELINQPRIVVVAPILISGLGFGTLLLGGWKIIEIQEDKLEMFEKQLDLLEEMKIEGSYKKKGL